jgi:site-specific DNA-adenine methylase
MIRLSEEIIRNWISAADAKSLTDDEQKFLLSVADELNKNGNISIDQEIELTDLISKLYEITQ